MKADRTFDAATLRSLVRYEDGRLYFDLRYAVDGDQVVMAL